MNDLARIADALERLAACQEIRTHMEIDMLVDDGGRDYSVLLTDHHMVKRVRRYREFQKRMGSKVRESETLPGRVPVTAEVTP